MSVSNSSMLYSKPPSAFCTVRDRGCPSSVVTVPIVGMVAFAYRSLSVQLLAWFTSVVLVGAVALSGKVVPKFSRDRYCVEAPTVLPSMGTPA